MQNRDRSKQVSVRLGLREHSNLAREAEAAGSTIADVMRARLRQAEQEIELVDLLGGLEKRLTQKVFSICSAIADLDAEQRTQAAEMYQQLQRKSRS